MALWMNIRNLKVKIKDKQFFNAVVALECTPASFIKIQTAIEVYECQLSTERTLVLSRMLTELENRGFSIATQTVEQRGVSCEDATSSVFETVSHSMRNEGTML